MMELYQRAATFTRHAAQLEQLADEGAFARAFGADGAWYALADECFWSAPLTEKRVKGFTAHVLPRAYVFGLCPFANVTQAEPHHGRWKAAVAYDEATADVTRTSADPAARDERAAQKERRVRADIEGAAKVEARLSGSR